MFSAILFRDFSVNSVCATGFQVCAFVCWTKADSNTRTYGRKQRIHAEHEQKALNLLYAAIATILISRANTHTLYLVFFSLVLVINRILAVSIAPLRLHFSYCAPLISIRQMDVMPIILMWTCWKLERNVQISAPFYWKYHRLFTSKSKFHSSLVCEQENTTFISTVNFLGYMDCRNWALFLSLAHFVWRLTQKAEKFSHYLRPAKYRRCACTTTQMMMMIVLLLFRWAHLYVCNAQQHRATAVVCMCLLCISYCTMLQ